MDIIRTSLLSAGQADEIKELLNGCRDSKGQTPFSLLRTEICFICFLQKRMITLPAES